MPDECLLILLLSNNKEYIGNNFVNLLKLPFLTQFNKNKRQTTWPMFAMRILKTRSTGKISFKGSRHPPELLTHFFLVLTCCNSCEWIVNQIISYGSQPQCFLISFHFITLPVLRTLLALICHHLFLFCPQTPTHCMENSKYFDCMASIQDWNLPFWCIYFKNAQTCWHMGFDNDKET